MIIPEPLNQWIESEGAMRIAIGSDHAGFELKEKVKGFLQEMGHPAVDLGTHSLAPVDYPDYAEAVSLAVLEGKADREL